MTDLRKVYVVDSQKVVSSGAQVEPQSPAAETKKAGRSSKPSQRKRNSHKGWKQILIAYLLGPVIQPFMSNGRRRIIWSVMGPGSVAVGVTLLVFRSHFTTLIEAGYYGVLLWLITVSAVVLSFITAWAAAISSVNSKREGRGSKQSFWVRDPRCVSSFGFIVPGLGLMITGHPRRAAWAFWILGPLAVASIVLLNWRWLWECSRVSAAPGISGVALETVFVVAAGVAAMAILSWIIQALEGARLVSSHCSNRLGDTVGIALLVSLVLLLVLFRPVSFAQELHSASVPLQQNGFKLIPLTMNEAAMRLDSATPVYLASAAELNEIMGMKTAAHAKREILEQRAKEYIEFIPGDNGDSERPAKDTIESTREHSELFDGPPGVIDQIP